MPQAQKFWAFSHLLGAFGASFCAEMVKNAQNFRACGGLGGLRRFLIGNGNYLLHATFAARALGKLVGPRSLALRARGPQTKKQKHVGVMSAARFLRAQGPLWKKTKRVLDQR